MRLGIFGGSFDPPHVGHLLVAEDACDQLALDRLVFVPAAVQPLKAGRHVTGAAHRLAMVRLLAEGNSRFDVSSAEVDRSGLSFTVETLGHFAAEFPAAERFLLVGADVLATFAQWREPERVTQLARLVVLHRADSAPAAIPAGVAADAIRQLATRRVDVSSTEIRQRVQMGKPVRGFVTDNVAAYIARHGLYR
ncbi:MAG TPA: nicotinate-nucleotide adenylyltransferase [Gemmatimonadaceae bacterium]|nr:nicotinate-nucleotide adenylyltransferase [Gemmatimonadaceae bacterium]